MEYKSESENRREARQERRREMKVDEIRKEDPEFIPPEEVQRKRRQGASFWTWVGVGVLILLLLVWLSIAMFTGDTDVDLITPFPWV